MRERGDGIRKAPRIGARTRDALRSMALHEAIGADDNYIFKDPLRCDSNSFLAVWQMITYCFVTTLQFQ